MKKLKKNIFAALIFVVLLNLGIGLNNVSSQAQELEQSQDFSYSRNYKNSSDKASQTVTAYSDYLLGKYEKSNREFIKIKIGNKIVYFHQRMIDEAIVEKDFIVYQFDRYSRELIEKIIQWRSGLPDYVVPRISRETAELMAEGDIVYTSLYIISPKSHVFPLTPIPENPCWVVRSTTDGNTVITVVDAMNGEILGYGIPPPDNGFTLSGPQYRYPCSGSWDSWYLNAKDWFDDMGYPTSAVRWPTRNEIQNAVQDSQVVLFYELAHGGSYYFAGGCSNGNYEYTFAADIEDWISFYPKKKFVFIGSCGGMCSTDDDSLSYEFRKDSSVNTATVGYCGMADPECDNCWNNSVDWQNALFNYMSQGDTVKQAFDAAVTNYPMCHNCVRFAGDIDLVLISIQAPINFTGEKVFNRSLSQAEYINVLT